MSVIDRFEADVLTDAGALETFNHRLFAPLAPMERTQPPRVGMGLMKWPSEQRSASKGATYTPNLISVTAYPDACD